jgi:type I restriction enzyme S subunit
MKSNYKQLSEYIREVNSRNLDGRTNTLLGINIDKYYMPSVANVVGTDLTVYKVVKKGQFACNRMHVGRDKRLPVALSKSDTDFIVSPAYDVFEIIDELVLNPEYLMMWFSRKEFDRNAWFYTDADVRGGLSWDAFCNMELPVPSIEKQKEIVKEYNIIINRIKLNEQLNQKLEETAKAIYKQWFVDFEFPDENGKPYKSSGGKMVNNITLDMEIPNGWEVIPLSEICDIKGGKRLPKGDSLVPENTGNPYIKVADMCSHKYIILNDSFEYVPKHSQSIIKRYTVNKNDLILSIVGTIGFVNIVHQSLDQANLTENCVKLTNFIKLNSDYVYEYLRSPIGKREIEMKTVGGVQGKLPIYNIQSIHIICPHKNIFDVYNNLIAALNRKQDCSAQLVPKLMAMQNILNAKMSKTIA